MWVAWRINGLVSEATVHRSWARMRECRGANERSRKIEIPARWKDLLENSVAWREDGCSFCVSVRAWGARAQSFFCSGGSNSGPV